MKKIILSNSEYNHLWNIINDYQYNDIIICVDDTKGFEFNHKVIYYEKCLNYTKRLIQILNQIDDEYIMLFSDVDIAININESVVSLYKNMMIENDIDRISFGVFDKNKDVITKENLMITNINNVTDIRFYTPYDYAPSIYKRKTLLKMCHSFPNETYQSFEQNRNVQNFVNDNFNFYGIQKSDYIKLVYIFGFVFSEDLDFLHITFGGKMMEYDWYYDSKNKLLDIIKKYNLKIDKWENHQFLKKNEF